MSTLRLEKALVLFFGIIFGLSTVLCAAASAHSDPFFIHYQLIATQPLGTGVCGKMVLSLTNTFDTSARDIMISLPPNVRYQFGSNSHCQAGTLTAGQQCVLQENLFDPEGLSKTGKLTFIVSYTDAAGNRQTVTVKAVGIAEVEQ